jgi:hypothetical protein
VDRLTLAAIILKGADMHADQQLPVFRELIGARTGADRETRVRAFVEELYDESGLTTPAGCEKLMAGGPDAINADAFVAFSKKVESEQTPITAKNAKLNSRVSALRAKFIEAWLGWKKGEVTYPDANRTIRFTYGTVKPYSPRDGLDYRYSTTLTGVIEKEQAVEPFTVPARLKELWLKKDYGRYVDPKTGDIPVAFLANLDITGGNSGSPVINGKGELIGCAFDSNWEAVVGDYLFQNQYNRTISVDARYMLFVIDKYSGAENLMKELVVK